MGERLRLCAGISGNVRVSRQAGYGVDRKACCEGDRGETEETGAFMAGALQELSVGLCRVNSDLHRRIHGVLARERGSAFLARMTVPILEVQMSNSWWFGNEQS